jgi:hypothetical protein
VVDNLELVVESRRRLDDALGGATVFRAVREDLPGPHRIGLIFTRTVRGTLI